MHSRPVLAPVRVMSVLMPIVVPCTTVASLSSRLVSTSAAEANMRMPSRTAPAGSRGFEGVFTVSRRLRWSSPTTSVNVPPTSMPITADEAIV